MQSATMAEDGAAWWMDAVADADDVFQTSGLPSRHLYESAEESSASTSNLEGPETISTGERAVSPRSTALGTQGGYEDEVSTPLGWMSEACGASAEHSTIGHLVHPHDDPGVNGDSIAVVEDSSRWQGSDCVDTEAACRQDPKYTSDVLEPMLGRRFAEVTPSKLRTTRVIVPELKGLPIVSKDRCQREAACSQAPTAAMISANDFLPEESRHRKFSDGLIWMDESPDWRPTEMMAPKECKVSSCASLCASSESTTSSWSSSPVTASVADSHVDSGFHGDLAMTDGSHYNTYEMAPADEIASVCGELGSDPGGRPLSSIPDLTQFQSSLRAGLRRCFSSTHCYPRSLQSAIDRVVEYHRGRIDNARHRSDIADIAGILYPLVSAGGRSYMTSISLMQIVQSQLLASWLASHGIHLEDDGSDIGSTTGGGAPFVCSDSCDDEELSVGIDEVMTFLSAVGRDARSDWSAGAIRPLVKTIRDLTRTDSEGSTEHRVPSGCGSLEFQVIASLCRNLNPFANNNQLHPEYVDMYRTPVGITVMMRDGPYEHYRTYSFAKHGETRAEAIATAHQRRLLVGDCKGCRMMEAHDFALRGLCDVQGSRQSSSHADDHWDEFTSASLSNIRDGARSRERLHSGRHHHARESRAPGEHRLRGTRADGPKKRRLISKAPLQLGATPIVESANGECSHAIPDGAGGRTTPDGPAVSLPATPKPGGHSRRIRRSKGDDASGAGHRKVRFASSGIRGHITPSDFAVDFEPSATSGGAENLVNTPDSVSMTPRLLRLCHRAMQFPYVQGVAFEPTMVAWRATVGLESRKFLVKKHGWVKSRAYAIQRVHEWRDSMNASAGS